MRIGIIGCGHIAEKMARTVHMTGHTLYAVASRTQEKADRFASRFEAEHAYGSYERLAEDSHVDLVYVAVPHSFHAQVADMCLDQGRHVLVEKAFTSNASEAEPLVRKAERQGLLLAEAIWTRYEPIRTRIDQAVEGGEIGQVCHAEATYFAYLAQKPRLVEPSLAGGSLLDIGIYALNFLLMNLKGDVTEIQSMARLSDKGVDELSSTSLRFSSGAIGSMQTGYTAVSDRSCQIAGSSGWIWVDNVNNPQSVKVYDRDRNFVRDIPVPPQLTGFEYELDSCCAAIREGRTECPQMPHSEMLRVMRLMDAMRAQWGMVYPWEQ